MAADEDEDEDGDDTAALARTMIAEPSYDGYHRAPPAYRIVGGREDSGIQSHPSLIAVENDHALAALHKAAGALGVDQASSPFEVPFDRGSAVAELTRAAQAAGITSGTQPIGNDETSAVVRL